MTAKWGSCVFLLAALAFLGGCRTSQPNLKPDNTPEVLVDPPTGGHYDTPGMPKAAFDQPEDPGKKAMESKLGSSRSGPSMGAGPTRPGY